MEADGKLQIKMIIYHTKWKLFFFFPLLLSLFMLSSGHSTDLDPTNKMIIIIVIWPTAKNQTFLNLPVEGIVWECVRACEREFLRFCLFNISMLIGNECVETSRRNSSKFFLSFHFSFIFIFSSFRIVGGSVGNKYI